MATDPHPLAQAFSGHDVLPPENNVVPLHRGNGVSSRDGRVLNEQPWHRAAAHAMLSGKTNKQIALYFDVAPETVSLLRQQSWFQRIVAELAADAADDGFLGLLQGGANAAIEELTELVSDKRNDPRVRASAASKLLDSYIKVKPAEAPKPVEDPQAELKKVNEEIKSLENQLPE